LKVVGFTIVRNAIKYDYPVVESILSILPICDEVVVSIGDSEDNTLDLIKSIGNEKIKIVHSVWDLSLREGGELLAVETNKAMAQVAPDADWLIYIQADEVIPESSHSTIVQSMHQYHRRIEVDGLLLSYIHFYGSYDFYAASSKWYTHEIRIFRNHIGAYSYRDAQGFRKGKNEKLRVKAIEAWVHHYGWVKHPTKMQLKRQDFNKLYHDDEWVKTHIPQVDQFDYHESVTELRRFMGRHPKVMYERITRLNWSFNFDVTYNKITLKDKFKSFLKKYLGWDLSYRNYKIIK
jgi:glycosyltransferase involved in cell wall biosynthesis